MLARYCGAGAASSSPTERIFVDCFVGAGFHARPRTTNGRPYILRFHATKKDFRISAKAFLLNIGVI